MSGHSKWSQIKHKKAQTDSQKSRVFGKLSRDMQIAARAGNDPTKNAALREAIVRAKKANMPQQSIDRLLDVSSNAALTEVTYEGFGPEGAALLVMVATDNPNRAVAEIRTLFKKHGGTLGTPGSVRWRFGTHTRLVAGADTAPSDALLEQLIDAGADDVTNDNQTLHISVHPAALPALQEVLQQHHVTVHDTITETRVLPEHQQAVDTVTRAKINALYQALMQHPDVRTIATDIAR